MHSERARGGCEFEEGKMGLTKTSQCDMLCKLGFHCKLFD